MSNFHATILTLFPEMFPGPLEHSLAGKALENNIWSLEIRNIRDHGLTKHRNVDAPACGGGNGMVMRPDVLGSALDSALKTHKDAKIYYPSPRGRILNQGISWQLSKEKNIIILCGRFEGIDERIIDEYNVCQISMGDYILSGGEIAAMAILDSVVRLIPGVLANQNTLKEESFEKQLDGYDLIEHPLYTKPVIWRGKKVPKILLSGHHSRINEWKQNESLKLTKARTQKNKVTILGNEK